MLQNILNEMYHIFFSLAGCGSSSNVTDGKIEVNYYDNTITDKTGKKTSFKAFAKMQC